MREFVSHCRCDEKLEELALYFAFDMIAQTTTPVEKERAIAGRRRSN
jgi:hypothetical protein